MFNADNPPPSGLQIAVFRAEPKFQVQVTGPCNARQLCLHAGTSQGGLGAVFVSPLGSLIAVAVAAAPVVEALAKDARPIAHLARLLDAAQLYVEVPAASADRVERSLVAATEPDEVVASVLSRP